MWMSHDTQRLNGLADLVESYDILPRLKEQAEREGTSWERLIPADHVIFAPLTSDYLLGTQHLPRTLGPWVFPARIAAAIEWERTHKWPSMEEARRQFRRATKKLTRKQRPSMLRRLVKLLGFQRSTGPPDSEF